MDDPMDDAMADSGPAPAGRRSGRPRRERRPQRPLDTAQLQDLALGYAARYATTAARLERYLARKLGERGWSDPVPADPAALVSRLCSLGYVDDRAWAAARARDLGARGLGARRVRGALAAAGVDREDIGAVLDRGADGSEDGGGADEPGAAALATAITFARRRRFGPFARTPDPDPARQRRELAAMARAGHDFDIARRVLLARDEAAALALLDRD